MAIYYQKHVSFGFCSKEFDVILYSRGFDDYIIANETGVQI